MESLSKQIRFIRYKYVYNIKYVQIYECVFIYEDMRANISAPFLNFVRAIFDFY
jgi:hypothetical protein